jgi:hypothetical protein
LGTFCHVRQGDLLGKIAATRNNNQPIAGNLDMAGATHAAGCLPPKGSARRRKQTIISRVGPEFP